jgi:hypothetical protein
MSSGSRWVDAGAFGEALAPMTQRIRDFTSAVKTVGEGRKLPSAESPAMREISAESEWAKRSGWHAPFADTHSLAELTLRAANDYVHTFADTFNTERTPLYGHLVLARSALESSVICWWLSEPGIARDERIKRGLSEYIYSAVEEQRWISSLTRPSMWRRSLIMRHGSGGKSRTTTGRCGHRRAAESLESTV